MKKSSFLTRLFSHNIVLLILSFLLAFIAWFIISAYSQTDTSVTISNIPVNIELPDTVKEKGFQIFSDTDFTASVDVKGNRVTVGSLTASDIQISASQLSTINRADEYNLPLTAKKVGVKTDYDIVSTVNPSSVTVYVDKFKEKDMTIDKKVQVENNKDDYYADVSYSDDTVHISGAANKIDEIETVAVVDTIDFDGTEQKTLQEALVFYDKNNTPVDLQYVETDIKSVEITVNPQPKKEVKIKLDVENQPAGAPDPVLTPSKITVYGPSEQIASIEKDTISIGTLDYRTLTNSKHQIPFDITLPTTMKDCHVIGDNSDSVIVNIDLSAYKSTKLTKEIKVVVDSKKYEANITSDTYIDLTIFGPESQISKITEDDIAVIVDTTSEDIPTSDKTVSVTVTPTVKFGSSFSGCWVYYGDNEPIKNPVNVNITPKS